MNSTVGLEFKACLSSHRKVAACRVFQHGCPGCAPAVGLPGGYGEPGAGEGLTTVRGHVGSAQSANLTCFKKDPSHVPFCGGEVHKLGGCLSWAQGCLQCQGGEGGAGKLGLSWGCGSWECGDGQGIRERRRPAEVPRWGMMVAWCTSGRNT